MKRLRRSTEDTDTRTPEAQDVRAEATQDVPAEPVKREDGNPFGPNGEYIGG